MSNPAFYPPLPDSLTVTPPPPSPPLESKPPLGQRPRGFELAPGPTGYFDLVMSSHGSASPSQSQPPPSTSQHEVAMPAQPEKSNNEAASVSASTSRLAATERPLPAPPVSRFPPPSLSPIATATSAHTDVVPSQDPASPSTTSNHQQTVSAASNPRSPTSPHLMPPNHPRSPSGPTGGRLSRHNTSNFRHSSSPKPMNPAEGHVNISSVDYANTGNPANLTLTGGEDLGRHPSMSRRSTYNGVPREVPGNVPGNGHSANQGHSRRMSRYSGYDSAQGNMSVEDGGSGTGSGTDGRGGAGEKGMNHLDSLVPTLPQQGLGKESARTKERTVDERLGPTLTAAEKEKDKASKKAYISMYLLNIAIGAQVLLGALTTALGAALTGKSTSVAISILGGAATLVASYLARVRGSNEPETSLLREKMLESYIRRLSDFKQDYGHEVGHRYDDRIQDFRTELEGMLQQYNGQQQQQVNANPNQGGWSLIPQSWRNFGQDHGVQIDPRGVSYNGGERGLNFNLSPATTPGLEHGINLGIGQGQGAASINFNGERPGLSVHGPHGQSLGVDSRGLSFTNQHGVNINASNAGLDIESAGAQVHYGQVPYVAGGGGGYVGNVTGGYAGGNVGGYPGGSGGGYPGGNVRLSASHLSPVGYPGSDASAMQRASMYGGGTPGSNAGLMPTLPIPAVVTPGGPGVDIVR